MHDTIPPLARKLVDYLRCIDTATVCEEFLIQKTAQMIDEHLPIRSLEAENALALREAVRLAQIIWRRSYRETAPQWKPLTDTAGVISQIDNMCAGLLQRLEEQRSVIRELREAVNPIIDPTVTKLTVDGTLDMINAARKADALLSSNTRVTDPKGSVE